LVIVNEKMPPHGSAGTSEPAEKAEAKSRLAVSGVQVGAKIPKEKFVSIRLNSWPLLITNNQ
jgi:hypothetical protein